jgi:transposase
MARPQKEPLRTLTAPERTQLETLANARNAPVACVTRARQLLAVADGADFVQVAHASGGHCRQSVSRLVARFNRDGMDTVWGKPGGHPPVVYGPEQQARILTEFARIPDREQDQTAVWSLTTLQRALRRAPDGLPRVSTYVILQTLHQAGYTWQEDRTWCNTGTVQRKRNEGIVTVTDPLATEKRGRSSRRTR